MRDQIRYGGIENSPSLWQVERVDMVEVSVVIRVFVAVVVHGFVAQEFVFNAMADLREKGG